MCGCGDASHDAGQSFGKISRRAAMVAGSAVLGAAALGTAACSPAESPQSPPTPAPPAALPDNALITVGVAAGPPPTPNKFGICSVLKLGNDLYVIDCGLGSLNGFTNAGLKFGDIKKMFITHLHADHIVDYYSFFLSGGNQAKPGQAPVLVYGPGSAGGLPASEVGNANPPTINPANPTPGLAAMTASLNQAFAYTGNVLIRDQGIDDIESLMKVTEIAVPPGSDYLNRSPTMEPFAVVADDKVTVTATLVSHYDVYPAFAVRFDIKNPAVSVTFSGDTTKNDNLIRLAHDTDILVHEAEFSLDDAFYDNRFPPNYLQNSHTSAEQVGEVAAAANAKHLVLSHYQASTPRGPVTDSQWLEEIKKHYSGKSTVAQDGQVFAL
jgi:ribonuclease BN (tRNA processing enzyme)